MSIVSNQYDAYFPEFSSTALQQFISNNTRNQIPAIRLFLARYKAFPCLLSCPKIESNALFHIQSILNYLKNQLNHDLTNDIIIRKYHIKAKQYFARYVFQKKT